MGIMIRPAWESPPDSAFSGRALENGEQRPAADLLVAMRSGIARIRRQRSNRTSLDLVRGPIFLQKQPLFYRVDLLTISVNEMCGTTIASGAIFCRDFRKIPGKFPREFRTGYPFLLS